MGTFATRHGLESRELQKHTHSRKRRRNNCCGGDDAGYFGKDSKAVVWAHNSHIGNALATEMYARGEINIGHLCKEHFGSKSYHIGFGTHTGTVAAARNWGESMEKINVNESVENSYENLCHKTNVPNFTLRLREENSEKKLRDLLSTPKFQRAIGVVYKPETELMSHYFKAVLPSQFDEYIWFNKTKAITPLKTKTKTKTKTTPRKLKNIHPFGLFDKYFSITSTSLLLGFLLK